MNNVIYILKLEFNLNLIMLSEYRETEKVKKYFKTAN